MGGSFGILLLAGLGTLAAVTAVPEPTTLSEVLGISVLLVLLAVVV